VRLCRLGRLVWDGFGQELVAGKKRSRSGLACHPGEWRSGGKGPVNGRLEKEMEDG